MINADMTYMGKMVRVLMVDNGSLIGRIVQGHGGGVFVTCSEEVYGEVKDFFIPFAFIAMIEIMPDKETT